MTHAATCRVIMMMNVESMEGISLINAMDTVLGVFAIRMARRA
jgi:hypothetical protein